MSTEGDTPSALYALAALKKQRATVSGRLLALESQIRLERAALSHIDAVLLMFAPEIDPASIPARRKLAAQEYRIPGLSRRIRGLLRRHNEPMSTPDVIEALVAEMAFPPEAARVISHNVRYALRNLANAKGGAVVKEGERDEARWRVVHN